MPIPNRSGKYMHSCGSYNRSVKPGRISVSMSQGRSFDILWLTGAMQGSWDDRMSVAFLSKMLDSLPKTIRRMAIRCLFGAACDTRAKYKGE